MKYSKYTFLILALSWFLFSSFDGKNSHAILIKDHCNTIELMNQFDTLLILDPITGQNSLNVVNRIYVISLNGNRVYEQETQPIEDSTTTNERLIYNRIIKGIEPLFLDIEDGRYTIEIPALLINAKGKLVYDSSRGVSRVWSDPNVINPAIKRIIDKKITDILDQEKKEKFSPLLIDNKAVPQGIYIYKLIRITNHHMELLN